MDGNLLDVAWFLVGLVSSLIAVRAQGFWLRFLAALVGLPALAVAGPRLLFADLDLPARVCGLLLIIAGLALYKRPWGLGTASVGAAVTLFTFFGLDATILWAAIGIAFVVLSAIYRSWRYAPMIAVLGLLLLLPPSSGLSMEYGVSGGILQIADSVGSNFGPELIAAALVVVVAMLIALFYLARRTLAARLVAYLLVFAWTLGLGRFTHFAFPWDATTSWLAGTAAPWLNCVLGFGPPLALARRVLFAPPQGVEHRTEEREMEAQSRPAPAPAQTPADVFISYKRDERARVEQIAQALRALKLSVWFDARLQSGHSFDAEINREVRAAKCVLVCWSPGAVASEWVRAEAAIGRQRGVLAACFLEPCELYPPFNLVHAEDLSRGALDASNPAWTKLVDQLGRLAGRPGLGGYVGMGADRAAQGIWLAENPNDPLAEVLMARLRQG